MSDVQNWREKNGIIHSKRVSAPEDDDRYYDDVELFNCPHNGEPNNELEYIVNIID